MAKMQWMQQISWNHLLQIGELQLIGTTTLKEYRKHIEKDSALERRFQTVIVEEPNPEKATDILMRYKKILWGIPQGKNFKWSDSPNS